jgi:uncharacterized protein
MDYTCISADDHIDLRFLPEDLFTERAPAHLRDRVPHVVPVEDADTPEMYDWIADGKVLGVWGCYPSRKGGTAWAIERGGALEPGVLRPTIPELRLADMDRDGVQASVMYGPTDPFLIDDPEVRHATFRAYNDWVLEFEKAAPERIIGVAQLDNNDPEFAADELERTAGLGIRHVNVLAGTATPSWYEPEWERFWSIADETGIPIGSHLTVVVRRGADKNAKPKPDYSNAVLNLGQQLVDPYAGLILTGCYDRHPGLKTVMAESQISWVPNMIQTLDNGWTRGRAGTLAGVFSASELKPSEYFERNIWMTFQDDAFGVQMLPMLHEDKVMWASDYPHPASTWPESQQIIKRQLDGVVNDETRRKLLVDNAKALYGL